MLYRGNHVGSSTGTVKDDPTSQQVKPTGDAAKAELLASTASAPVIEDVRVDDEPADWWKELNTPSEDVGVGVGVGRPVEDAGVLPNRHQRRRYRARGRHFLDSGERAAALRGHTAAMLHQGKGMSLVDAAPRAGSSVAYARAMDTVIRSEDARLLDHTLAGHIPVFLAAERARPVADLITAFRNASIKDVATLLVNKLTESQQTELGRHLGPDWTWDRLIMPVVGRSEAEHVKF